jgi:hypothetical protein
VEDEPMFIREGQRFTAADNYRDDALGRKALDLAQRGPLMVTGLAGIGKSWFLRRLAALAVAKESRHFQDDGAPFTHPAAPSAIAAVEAYDAHADGADALALALTHRLRRPDPRRLLLLDGLEALLDPAAPSAGALVEAILCHPGPLVMAAPPAILSIPGLERCRSLVLPPLSPPERRALMLQTLDPFAGLDAEAAALGLDQAWGGHPMVLQQVGALRKRSPGTTLDQLMEGVSERLPGYGAAIARSVTALEHEALLAVARGQAVGERLRGAALSLTLHGALVRGRGGWDLESRVLSRALLGTAR